MTLNVRKSLGMVDEFARRIDTARLAPVYRLVIGFCVVPVFAWWYGDDGLDWRLVPFFLFILLALRLVPAIVRHVVPFSADLKAQWARHRLLAKRFDSYQWRKLLWFGLGLAAYLPVLDRARVVPSILAAACLLSGSLGMVTWHRLSRTPAVVGAVAGRVPLPE